MPQKKPNFTTILHIEAKGSQGTTPLECIRNTIAKVMTELSGRGKLKGIQLLTNNPIGSSNKPITSASAVPLKWISATNYVTCLNDTADLTKEIRGNKLRTFKLIITIGSAADIRKTVEANAVDMAQEGVLVEVKRLQALHSKVGALLPMIPWTTDAVYVQKEAQACFSQAIEQAIDETKWSNPRKCFEKLKDTKILVTTGYPPMNFEKYKKNTKLNYNAKSKQIYNIEYNMQVEPLLAMAKHAFKILLRQRLGLKTFML